MRLIPPRVKPIATALIWCGLGLMLGLTLAALFVQTHFVTERVCAADFPTTVARFKAIVNENPKWEIYPVPCIPAAPNGERLAIFRLCNKQAALTMLNASESRRAAAFIPCQIAIYEKNGRCCFAQMNMDAIAFLLGGKIRDTFCLELLPDQARMFAPLFAK